VSLLILAMDMSLGIFVTRTFAPVSLDMPIPDLVDIRRSLGTPQCNPRRSPVRFTLRWPPVGSSTYEGWSFIDLREARWGTACAHGAAYIISSTRTFGDEAMLVVAFLFLSAVAPELTELVLRYACRCEIDSKLKSYATNSGQQPAMAMDA
jgi:hypothetical protein